MRRRPWVRVLVGVLMLGGYAKSTVALDAETQRREREVMCQAMPWSCGKIERAPDTPPKPPSCAERLQAFCIQQSGIEEGDTLRRWHLKLPRRA